jgi:hypothetical protein
MENDAPGSARDQVIRGTVIVAESDAQGNAAP